MRSLQGIKVQQVTTEPQEEEISLLDEGDMVMTTVTHEVTIDGEKSWIKHGASTKVRSGETAAQARDRLSRYVSEGALNEVEANVTAVRSFTARFK